MDVYKLVMSIDSRNIECFVREGIPGMVETGKMIDKVKAPEMKIFIVVGKSENKPAAWVQVARINNEGIASITHEGWIGDNQQRLMPLSKSGLVSASLESVKNVDKSSLETLQNAVFGTFGCCTAYGKGCYVTCCNSCCSDPARCPGASCCG